LRFCPKLGRPPKVKHCIVSSCWKNDQNPGERNAIESSFGVEKRRYGLNLVMERLGETSEVAIHTRILTMNLWKHLRELILMLFRRALRAPT
jgi:IS5 family transposase